MDYELKRVVAICLIVKLVALSSELSIKPQGETFKQGSDTVKSQQLTSLAAVKEPWTTSMSEKHQGVHFNLGAGRKKSNKIRKFNKKSITKSKQIRLNSAFDACKHMAELLQTSKWRDIQKTLRRLNRVLASSRNNRSCRQSGKSKSRVVNEKLSLHSSKIKSKSETYFTIKKNSDSLLKNCRQNLLTSHNRSEEIENLENECEHKYKVRKNKLKVLYPKKSKKQSKKGKYFHKKIQGKHHHFLTKRPQKGNNARVESKNVFSNREKLYYPEKENKTNKLYFKNAFKICGSLQQKLEDLERKASKGLTYKEDIFSKKLPLSLDLKNPLDKNYKKQNPWPNFVYHRVSSDLFHLKSTASNHKQSAYVAISVNNSGEPEAIRNKNKIFGK